MDMNYTLICDLISGNFFIELGATEAPNSFFSVIGHYNTESEAIEAKAYQESRAW